MEQGCQTGAGKTHQGIYALGILFLLLLGIGVFALSSRPYTRSSAGAASGLFLIDSVGGNSGNGLVHAPAVDAQQMQNRLVQAGASTGGEVEVSLAWNTLTDLDIQIVDPFGEKIAADHPRSAHAGIQDVDANPTPTTMEGSMLSAEGRNPGIANVLPIPQMLVDSDDHSGISGLFRDSPLPAADGKAPARYTRKPVEHIYFAHAPKGIYTVYVHCYMWRESDEIPLPFTVQVRSNGKVFHQVTGTIGPASYITTDTAPIQVCQFEIR